MSYDYQWPLLFISGMKRKNLSKEQYKILSLKEKRSSRDSYVEVKFIVEGDKMFKEKLGTKLE